MKDYVDEMALLEDGPFSTSPEVTDDSCVWPSIVKREWAGILVLVGDSAEFKEKMLHTSFFLGICEDEIVQHIMETIVGQKVLSLDSLKEKG